jgi:hypothetical protein
MNPGINQNDNISNVVINKTEYSFKAILVNPEGKFFAFRYEAIKELVILNSFDSYYDTGYMIVDDSYDVLERLPDDTVVSSIPYEFRGDARDFLHIEIMPRLQNNNITQDSTSTAKEVFCLSYDLAIYNVEDILGEQASTKFRKLYFWDLMHQILLEKNTSFSTAEMLSNTNSIANKSDTEREVFTGDAIKGLLQKTFSPDNGFNLKFSKFDSGSTKTFFTAPANFKAEDSLQYLLSLHVSSKENNYDKAILRIEHPAKWSLMSLNEYFKQAYDAKNDAGGVLFLERFIIGGNTDFANANKFDVVVSRSPKLSIHFADTNVIENFSFIPPAGQFTQQEVNNKITYNSDISTGIFAIDIAENNFERAQKVYKQNYVDTLKGNKNAPASNLIGNRLRTTQQNINHIYSVATQPEQRLGVGRSDMLKKAVLLNNTISFRVKGATYRDTGRFISIDRDNSLPDSAFDNRLLGIYLIVSIKHIFTGGDYYTELLCVKTYNFTDLGEQGAYV